MRATASLNIITNDHSSNSCNPSELLDLISDFRYSPDEYILEIAKLDALDALLSSLNEYDCALVKMKFGWAGNPAESYETTALRLDLTREQVVAHLGKIIRKLKRHQDLKTLKDFI